MFANKKKNLAVIFGIGDNFCSKESYRVLKVGEKLKRDVDRLLSDTKKDFYGAIKINEYFDTFDKISINHSRLESSRIVDLSLYNTTDLFSPENLIELKDRTGGENVLLNGDMFDHMFPPEEYNLFICGVDISGIFIKTVDDFIDLGYDITVFSNIVKPFSKATIDHLVRKAKDRGNSFRFGKS